MIPREQEFTAVDQVRVGTGVGTCNPVTLEVLQFLARKATGPATNVSAEEARAVLNVEDGADVTDDENVRAALAAAAAEVAFNNQNIGTVGTVDGRDISVDGSTLDTHVAAATNPHSVTAAQVGTYDSSQIDVLIDATMKAPEAFVPSGTYPTTYDSNPVERGDSFRLTAAGTMGARTVNIEDLLIALVDTPGQTDANWMVADSNRDQATTTVKGVAELATQAEADAGTNDTNIVTPLKMATAIWASALTQGSIPFADSAGKLAQDNAKFFWNNTSKSLGIGTNSIDASAILQLDSTAKGFLPPRMSAVQREAISSPAEGLIAYDLTNHKADFYNGTVWKAFVSTDVSTFAVGSIPFATEPHHLNDDNANLFWDNSDKRLGVGINEPTETLHVAGLVRAYRFIMDSGGVVDSYIQKGEPGSNKGISFYTADIHRMIIAADGSVGIGTLTPGLPLDVRSADDNQALFFDTTAQAQGVGGGLAFGGKYTDAGAEAMTGRIGTKKTNSTSGHVGFDMVFETQDSVGSITERAIFTSDGKVGIGDVVPTKTLDVNGDARIIGETTINGDVRANSFVMERGTQSSYIKKGAYGVNKGMSFYTVNNHKMILSEGGNLGIGTTDPKAKLHVVGLPTYADNTAAIETGGLTAGAFYRTSDNLKVVH